MRFKVSYFIRADRRTDSFFSFFAKVPKIDFIIQTHKLSAVLLVHSKPVQQ